ncbi:MAG: 1-acyl-sn-glycerol-3-phosphate acyltransferase [Clostridia bacterium]|nr:1-acyl-sn-glycerol-3-phosphate acyltransferase [Clostridia bacterium]
MKIKSKTLSYEKVSSIPKQKHKKPKKPNVFWNTLIRVLSFFALLPIKFKYRKKDMERLGKKEPCLVLMNHSCFNDFEIASTLLYPRPFNIITTSDGFVGKNWLMRQIGCIPTQKFVTDVTLVRDIRYTVNTLKSSVLMYPEASYSFDGTATTLPESLGGLVKLLKVPVVMIETFGAFSRNPLYNNLQIRKVPLEAEMRYVLSPDEIKEKSVDEINEILRKEFSFDGFKWQQENKVKIDEPFRADELNRVLYKCPNCKAEGKTVGKGIHLTCHACGKQYELDEYGFMKAVEGETEFMHVPDWYAWERECVRQEILDGKYSLDVDVDIYMLVDTKSLYKVGEGHLSHTAEGFRLTGCDGQLDYSQKPKASYSLYSDYYWYEIGDMICIGNNDVLYYCFPKTDDDVVAKTRLATEEMYKIVTAK